MGKSQLQTLIELAESELEDATKALGRAIKAKTDAEAQLSTLIQYRGDYENRLESSAQRGLSVAQFANFQAFIAKLDEAIEGQKRVITDAEYRVKNATEHWQACEKKRLSYQILENKHQQKQQLRETRIEQKRTDEIAARKTFYK